MQCLTSSPTNTERNKAGTLGHGPDVESYLMESDSERKVALAPRDDV